jgi:hypothetical protein
MSNTIHSQEPLDSPAQSSKPLDEAVWQAWLKKNLLEERQRATRRIKAVNWACIGLLLVTVVVSSSVSAPYVSAYQAAVRVAIGFGAIVMMLASLRTRDYVSTALFTGMVLLFNPLIPAFAFSGNWPILLLCVLPFVSSLAWMRECAQRAAARTPAF